MNVIVANNIYKSYQTGDELVQVLSGVSLEIFKNEIVIIKGPSGSGKTTLLKILATIIKPDKGSVNILNKNIKDYDLNYLRSRKIGFVFQKHHLFNELTAKENIEVPSIIINKIDSMLNSKVLLKEIDLFDKRNLFPSQLSTGENQRVAIARSMVNKPNIILADEPTGNLDKNNSLKVLNLIRRFRQDYDQTFLIVTHDDLFDKYANKIYELNNGTIKKI